MLVGETQKLCCERAVALGSNRSQKKYYFQGRHDEGLVHFQALSKSYPALTFVLVYGWDSHDYGSHLVSRGRVRSYSVPAALVEATMAKHGVDDTPPDELSFPYDLELDAEAELMDLTEARWQRALLRRGIC